MKKICLDLQPMLSQKTGIGYYTENLVKNLYNGNKNKYTGVTFSFFRRKKNQRLIEGIRYKHYNFFPFYSEKIRFISKFLPISTNFFLKENYDIYHSFNSNIPYKIKKNINVIITIHDLIPFLFPELCKGDKKKYFDSLVEKIKRVNIIITVSEYSKRDIIKYLKVDPQKIRIVSPGIELKDYERVKDNEIKKVKEKYNLPKKFILFLGALEPKKNIVNIIKGFERANLKNIKLVIAGGKGWKYEEIFETYKNSPYKKNIQMLDYIAEEDKIALYKGAELFIFPSLYEGFGMPVLEAMASGIPVITSNISSLPEVAGEAAILVNPYDIVEIAKAIENVIKNDKLKKEMIEKGLKQARKFTWENSVKKLEKIYSEL